MLGTSSEPRLAGFVLVGIVLGLPALSACERHTATHDAPAATSPDATQSLPAPDSPPAESAVALPAQEERPVFVHNPAPASSLRFKTVVLKETREGKPGYTIDASYPQIESPATPAQRRFNALVRSRVEGAVRYFKAYVGRRTRRLSEGVHEYEQTIGVSIYSATDEIVSLSLNEVSFTGYLNYDYVTRTLTFDLERGREVRLADVFRPGSPWLSTLATRCVDRLDRGEAWGNQRRYSLPRGDPMWGKGAEPTPENYGNWNVTPDGLLVTFAEYQVAAGMYGEVVVVIPPEELADVLRPGGPVARVAEAYRAAG